MDDCTRQRVRQSFYQIYSVEGWFRVVCRRINALVLQLASFEGNLRGKN